MTLLKLIGRLCASAALVGFSVALIVASPSLVRHAGHSTPTPAVVSLMDAPASVDSKAVVLAALVAGGLAAAVVSPAWSTGKRKESKACAPRSSR